MFTRDRLLSFGGPAILIVFGLFQLFTAFVPDGRYSWWAKTGSVLMLVVAALYWVYALRRRRDARDGTL